MAHSVPVRHTCAQLCIALLSAPCFMLRYRISCRAHAKNLWEALIAPQSPCRVPGGVVHRGAAHACTVRHNDKAQQRRWAEKQEVARLPTRVQAGSLPISILYHQITCLSALPTPRHTRMGPAELFCLRRSYNLASTHFDGHRPHSVRPALPQAECGIAVSTSSARQQYDQPRLLYARAHACKNR